MEFVFFIAAGVNGGIPKWIDAFLNEEFEEQNPELNSKLQDLKNAIADLIPLVDRGLKCVDCKPL